MDAHVYLQLHERNRSAGWTSGRWRSPHMWIQDRHDDNNERRSQIRLLRYTRHHGKDRVGESRVGYSTPVRQEYYLHLGATAAANDYLWGYGSVCSDPPFYTNSPSSYQFWTRDLWS